ncbi:MAG: response regulator [Desulfuromonadaceae bacterium]|nr:response regulator [Desulfuromonadaceae bacterium]MDD2848042.1 response regulator [Desulfuromonadaceae bacterium]MDD4132117.1 response regulator [Desulfuromonadaceae bacterium]
MSRPTDSRTMLSKPFYRLRRILIVMTALLLLILVSLKGWDSYNDYCKAITVAENQSKSYARALKEHAERVFSEADHALSNTAMEITDSGGIGSLDRESLTGLIHAIGTDSARIGSIAVIGSNGRMLALANDLESPLPDVSHREYFIFHRDNASTALHLGAPIKSLVSGKYRFTLSKRIDNRSGGFAGVVLATFNIDYFEKLYEEIVAGVNGRVSLVSLAGDYLVFIPSDEKVYSGAKKTAAFFRKRVAQTPADTYHNPRSNVAGEYRIVSYNRLDNYPVVAIVSFGRDSAIAAWRKDNVIYGVIVLGLSVLVFFMLRLILGGLREREAAARIMADQQAKLVNNITELERSTEERIVLEKQLLHAQKLESLGVMAGGIAHDFNNLLQSILGNMEMAALKLDVCSAAHHYIANAISSGAHAARLTNLMLTYVGKGIITKKELDLNTLVEENVGLLRSAASSAVTIELSLSEQLPHIRADVAQIQQVVMNLITNAAESIEKQPGCVRLTTGTQECDDAFLESSLLDEKPEAGRYVFLEVQDNGSGMSKDVLKRIFDPFFTTKFAGRGLGMSAVMGIMKTHGGALFVESEPGVGTTFRALFPAVDSVSTVHSGASVSSPPGEEFMLKSPLPAVALVVDDEKSVLKICATMVESCGYSVITACDGVDAIAKFREHAAEISVVIMDLTMPNMDGITAMRQIYAIEPDARVILASGFSKDDLDERLADHPPAGLICKPYRLSELEVEIRRVMRCYSASITFPSTNTTFRSP